LITGAGRGIGKGIALRFAAEGAAIALTSRNKAQLGQVASEIESAGGRAAKSNRLAAARWPSRAM